MIMDSSSLKNMVSVRNLLITSSTELKNHSPFKKNYLCLFAAQALVLFGKTETIPRIGVIFVGSVIYHIFRDSKILQPLFVPRFTIHVVN